MGHLLAALPFSDRFAQPVLLEEGSDLLLALLCGIIYGVAPLLPYALMLRGGLGAIGETSRSFGKACGAGYLVGAFHLFLLTLLYEMRALALWPLLSFPGTAAILTKRLALRFPRALLLSLVFHLLLAAFVGLVYGLFRYINPS